MCGRVVDRYTGIFGDRDHDQCEEGEAEWNAQTNLSRRHISRHGGQLGWAGDESKREHDHQHRRLGQWRDHDLTAGTDAAKACADIEACQRKEKSCAAEQGDESDQIGRPWEQQATAKGRYKRRRDPGPREHDVGDDAEEPRCAVCENYFLAKQPN